MKEENYENSKLFKLRHSAEHVLAQAMRKLYRDEYVPAVAHIDEDKFSNDALHKMKISDADFPKIEKEMRKIIQQNLPIRKEMVSISKAKEMFKGNKFKLEWIEKFESEGQSEVSIYHTGDYYYDLCKGPHLESTGEIKAFKLLSISGAYWKNDENNDMLGRIYGTAFESQEELDEYINRLEEAKKRDHRKLGKDLNLFVFSDLVGSGLPLWTEKGSIIRREIERFIVDEEIKRNYIHVYTPDIAKVDLYRTSGHYPYYKDSMYAPIKIDDEEFMLRPMTCPHHFELFKSSPKSYKELPMKIAELAKLYRYEKSGELTGLIRVRSFCLADSHIIIDKNDAEQQIHEVLDLIEYIAKIFGLKSNEDYWYRLSLGSRDNTEKYYDSPKEWEYAEGVLRKVLAKRDVKSYEAEDEAAFYGPKIDIQMKNVNGKEDTAFTCQYDFVMPKRFKLEFVNKDGEMEEPVVIHRSSVGAIERIIGFLIERYEAAFPVWMHPEQIAIIPVSDKFDAYAEKVKAQIKEAIPHARVVTYNDSERMQKRIREAQLNKIPYMLIIGGKEEENNSVNVRLRTNEELGEIKISEFVERVKKKIEEKSLDL
jgi:threonyl-tRNA synthetase